MDDSAKPGQPLPPFLAECVAKGVIDDATARRIDAMRKRTPGGAAGAGLAPTGEAERQYHPLVVDGRPSTEMMFDNFLPAKENAFTIELAQVVATSSAARSAFNPLYIYADVGLGKTHLLSAIANAARGKRSILVNATDLEVEFERAMRLGMRAELRKWLSAADILLIDDIQLCESREMLQQEFFALLNHMTRAGRSVVIASDVPPTRLAGVEQRLLSRLGAGAIVGLHMGDRVWRREILMRACGDQMVSDEVLDYVAEHVSESVRKLKAAAVQIRAFAMRGPVDLETARTLFGVFSEERQAARMAPSPAPISAPTPAPEETPRIVAPPPAPPPTAVRAPAPPPSRPAAPEPPRAPAEKPAEAGRAERFKQMVAGAETPEEQALALQIAMSERLRELRSENGDPALVERLDHALELLRDGRLAEALKWIEEGAHIEKRG